MTTPSSNKSSFATYFRYRLRFQFKFLIVSLILNIMALPIFSINILRGMKAEYEAYTSNSSSMLTIQLHSLMGGLEIISALVLFFMILFSGISVFDYCIKGERTDTVGGLPVTLRGRFWADLLSGYISRVAPFILCSVFSIIVSVSTDNWFAKLSEEMSKPVLNGIVIKSFAELIISLFFTYTFAYVLSVLITICCGKGSSSVAYTAVSSVVLIIGGCAASGFIISSQIGAGNFDDVIISLKYVPPLGMFFGKAYSVFDDIVHEQFNWMEFEFLTPATIIIYTIIAAALIAAAYFIFKHRKPENTGRSVAVKGFYHFFSGMVAFSLICICCYPLYQARMWWLSALVAAVVSAIALTIFSVANKSERSNVKKNLIRNAATIAGCIAFLFIFDKTGAFGTRYYNTSLEKTKSVYILINDYRVNRQRYESFIIDDKSDIEQFINANNKTLKNRSDELEEGTSFSVVYNLENGKTIIRRYGNRYISSLSKNPNAISEMFDNVYSLPNYPKYSSEKAAKVINDGGSISAVMHNKFGDIIIPEERVKEFSDILTREMLEKFDKNAEHAGSAFVMAEGEYSGATEIPILKCYTDTISFAESFRVYDGEAEAFSITKWSPYNDFNFDVEVKIKNANDKAEKELFSLFEPVTDDNVYSYVSNGFTIYSSNQVRYYVPDENTERVIDLMLTIIEKNYTQESS